MAIGDLAHDTALDDSDTDADSARLQDVHTRAMQRFNDVVPPQIQMRAESLAARRFVSIPGAQWEGPFGDLWADSIRLEVPKVKRGVQKIERDYRSNRLQVNFRAASGDASAETAETLDGIYRADAYHFKAQQARDNAFSEALKGGFGAYRLTNEWADPYDKDSDAQRINPAMTIVDADQSVFFDANSKLYDKSDAMFAWVLTAMTPQAFAAAWGDDKRTSWDNNLPKLYYDWYQPTVIRIAEYYEVEDKSERLYIFTQTLTGDEERWFASDITAEDRAEKQTLGWQARARAVKRRRVHKYIMSGAEVLEDQGYIAGSCIPIVPVYGNREYVDNMERFTGYVQDRMDSQRNYNARVSKLAETDALAPREIPIFAAEQMPPHIAGLWARQNIDRHPYAVVNPLLDPITGQIVSAGAIGTVSPPTLSPVTAALLQIANADLMEDENDGADEVKSNTSAEAMDLAATRIDAKSGIYIDNMRQSVQREGEIYLSMAADVYYEPGREVDTLTEDGEDGVAELVVPMTDKATGVYSIHNDFARGRYKVISDVTEATSTRRDKTVRAALNAVQAAGSIGDNEAGQVALSIAFYNMDGEGTDALQKFGRQRLVKMGLVEPNDEEKAAMEKAAQQPDPAAQITQAQVIALAASSDKDKSAAELNRAKVGQTEADRVLKLAQAHEVVDPIGEGPAAVPDTPSGLDHVERLANIDHTLARTNALRNPPQKTAA